MLQALGTTSPPPAEPPVTILSREGVTQGDPLSMVLYGKTLIPLAEELRAADPGLFSPFYVDDAMFDSLARTALKAVDEEGGGLGIFP